MMLAAKKANRRREAGSVQGLAAKAGAGNEGTKDPFAAQAPRRCGSSCCHVIHC